MKKICFVGISDKVGLSPFDSSSHSGKIVDQIIARLNVQAFKINYVSFPPLDEKGKLRYPTKKELEDSFPVFQKKVLEINPDVLVICGNMISKEIQKYRFYVDRSITIYHPSYIYVYHRKEIEQYIQDVVSKIQMSFKY